MGMGRGRATEAPGRKLIEPVSGTLSNRVKQPLLVDPRTYQEDIDQRRAAGPGSVFEPVWPKKSC